MITRERLKLLLANVLLIGAAGLLVVSLVSLTGVHRAVLSGASPADAFNPVPPVPVGLDPVVRWRPDPPTPRSMEPATRALLTDAWVGALGRLDAALASGESADLVTSFSGPALDQVLATLTAADVGSRQVPIGHDLELRFYSDDGSIVELRDHALRMVRVAGAQDQRTSIETVEVWDVLLLLRDGRWRVENLVRGEVEAVAGPSPAVPAPAGPWHGINLLPQASPWADTWERFDAAVAAADLDTVRSLGLNSVRVFVPYLALGGPSPDPALLDRIETFLDLAEDRDIGVVLTLFDGWTRREPLTWADADRHLTALVPVFARHPALQAWDLKNEPDRDDAAEGRAAVRAWLRHVAVTVRRLDARTPLTIGWSSAEAVDLVEFVDLVSFHHYGPAAALEEALPPVMAAAGDRPVVVQEFGLPTWNGLGPGGHSEPEQAAYLADVLEVARAAGVAGTYAWTLHDLAAPPPEAVGRPLRAALETSLGVLRTDGTAKPAAAVLDPSADLSAVRRPGALELRLRKPFWWLLGTSALSLAAALVVLFRRRRRGGASAGH